MGHARGRPGGTWWSKLSAVALHLMHTYSGSHAQVSEMWTGITPCAANVTESSFRKDGAWPSNRSPGAPDGGGFPPGVQHGHSCTHCLCPQPRSAAKGCREPHNKRGQRARRRWPQARKGQSGVTLDQPCPTKQIEQPLPPALPRVQQQAGKQHGHGLCLARTRFVQSEGKGFATGSWLRLL